MTRTRFSFLLVLLLLLAACGMGGSENGPDATTPGGSSSSSSSSGGGSGSSSAPSGPPTSTPDLRNRPRTGIFKKNQGGGSGTIAVTNNSGQDAAIYLMVSDEAFAQAGYVRDGEVLRLMGVKEGEFTINVISGLNWDMGKMDFTEGSVYYQMPETVTVSKENNKVELTLDETTADGGTPLTADAFPPIR